MYDLLKRISQGNNGADAAQDGRMEEVTHLLYRSCSHNDEKLHGSSGYGANLYDEQPLIAQYAETHNCWLPYDEVFRLGTPGPSGSENDTYVDLKGGTVYKVNNLIHTGSFYKLFRRLLAHNTLFPQTAYRLFGFTGYKDRSIYPLLTQRYIEHAVPATQEQIASYMQGLGFHKDGDWAYSNGQYTLSDLKPKNVLCDADGDIFVIDVEITLS